MHAVSFMVLVITAFFILRVHAWVICNAGVCFVCFSSIGFPCNFFYLQSLPVAFGVDAAKWICVGAIDATQLSVAGTFK
jgi:hypothetical protein